MAEELKACDQRKAFEAAILAANGQVPGNYNPEYDRYVSERRQGQYEGWKLARALLPSQVGEAVAMPATVEYVGKASGHGHVTPRADGVKARCGGPTLCRVCQKEQAALYTHPADQVAEPVLERPAKVGAGTFSAGLPQRLVVEAAYRQYEYAQDPPFTDDQIAALAKTFCANNP